MLLRQTAHGSFLIAGVVVHPQSRVTLAARFYPIHPLLKGTPLLDRAVGPPVLELRLAEWAVAVAGTKEVFELGACNRVLDALHVKPDVAGIGSRQRREALASDNRPQPVSRSASCISRGELQFSLLP